MSAHDRLMIKTLRRHAGRLEAAAKFCRELAKDYARYDRAEKARASFFAKQSKVDPSLTLDPRLPAVLFNMNEEKL